MKINFLIVRQNSLRPLTQLSNHKCGKIQTNNKDTFLYQDTLEQNLINFGYNKNQRYFRKNYTLEDFNLASLDKNQTDLILQRYSDDDSATYANLALKNNVSQTTVIGAVKSAILKAQTEKGIEPDEFKISAQEVCSAFSEQNLTYKKYVKACIDNPSLITQRPEVTISKVNKLISAYKDFGVTAENHIPNCLKMPQLFTINVENVDSNINHIVQTFSKYGLEKKDYIQGCIRYPELYSMGFETVENNVFNSAKQFEKFGLNLDEYIECCKKQPSLFYQSANSMFEKVNSVIENFKDCNLTPEKYMDICKKQAQLFYQSSDTISEHIDIIRLCRLNSGKSIDDDEFWEYVLHHYVDLGYSSSLLLIKGLIIPKMFEGLPKPSELKGSRIRQKLYDYIKSNPDDKYEISVIPICANTDLIKVLDETVKKISIDTLNRDDVFKINIIE